LVNDICFQISLARFNKLLKTVFENRSSSKNEIENALKTGEFKILVWSAVVAMSLNYLNALDRDDMQE